MTNMLRFSLLALLCGCTGCNLVAGLDDIQANPGSPGNSTSNRHLWSFAFGGSDDEMSAGIALSPGSNDIVWGGTSFGTVVGTPPYRGNGDALVMRYDSDQTYLGSGRYGDGARQAVSAVATSSGATVIVGTFSGVIDFSGDGSDPRSTHGEDDIFVASFDSGGELSWARTFGGTGSDEATAVAIDPSGSVVVVGSYWLSVSFDGHTVETTASGPRAFVARLAGDSGDALNAVDFPMSLDTSQSRALGVAADGDDNVTVVGTFAGTMDLESPCTALASQGAEDFDGFVVQLGLDLACTASKSLATAGEDRLQVVAAPTNASGVVVGGRAGAGFDLGCQQQVGQQGETVNLVVAHLDDFLQCEWQGGYATGEGSETSGLGLTPTGAILVGGRFGGSVDLGGGPLSAAGGYAAFLASLTSEGAHTWSSSITGGTTQITGLAVDGDASVVVTGESDEATSWGGETIGGGGGFDAVIAMYEL